MPKESMTPRERWLAVLERRKPDRVPTDYWATGEASQKLVAHLGAADLDEALKRLHVDNPAGLGPKYVGPKPPEGEDELGHRFRKVDYGTGVYTECVHHPLARFTSVDEIEANYRWPTPDWWDTSDLPARAAKAAGRPIRAGGSEPFLTYCHLRGQEQAMMDLVLNPEMVHHCLDKLFDLAYERTRRIYETIPGKVTFSYVAEDLGSQEDLLYSPAQIREFLLPRMKRMMDLAHSAGAFVFTHSDGAVRKIIPDLISIGMDVLNPVQWRCRGMEREGLKRDFGAAIRFHGGVDNQQTLPFGTVEDVRKEVRDNLRILGTGGGYILAPCHNIQSITPMENVVAMYETAYNEG
jgi:uroporphyrinogen decarboxylase